VISFRRINLLNFVEIYRFIVFLLANLVNISMLTNKAGTSASSEVYFQVGSDGVLRTPSLPTWGSFPAKKVEPKVIKSPPSIHQEGKRQDVKS
jgi:hypothetical protein